MNRNIKLIFKTYFLVLSIFSIFRLVLFFLNINNLDLNSTPFRTILGAFIMGVRFDIVISGYILFIPAFILLLQDVFKINNKRVLNILFYWTFVLFSIAFVISAADIPYFNQFFERFSIGAFKWIEHPKFVVSMIIQEPKYYLIIFPFFVIEFVFFKLLKKIFYPKHKKTYNFNIYANLTVSLLVLALMFLGIRGRIEKKSPIRVGTAYFSDNAFLNKLGLNPVFTFMRSYLDSLNSKNASIKLMDKDKAFENIKRYYKIPETSFGSPIARKVDFDTTLIDKPNVVIIIMESMSAAKMKRYGSKDNLTPFLDSLANKSICFDNVYSAGKHTFNGVFSTLFSFPALYRQHTMKKIRVYGGISSTLLSHGYSTSYFTTHDSQFDNVEGFLRANNFEQIISQSNYPSKEVKTTLGVPDDYMFRYSIPVINELAKKEKPFFVTFMTASDHGPYYIPEYFHAKSTDIKKQIVEYADWSLKRFIELAQKEKWFNNTIFVFLADHGASMNVNYEIPLNYFHIPLIFYAPNIIEQPKVYKNIGSQVDVYPTVMGFLKQSYINNTLGINLLEEQRTFAVINDDDKIGILDTIHLCIMKNQGQKAELYNYRKKEKQNLYEQEKKQGRQNG